MTLLFAELKRPEVAISPIEKLGRNAVRTCEVVYDELKVVESDRVGEEGKGFRYLLDGLNTERILIAAEAVGIGRAALARAVSYANERVVFGRPIGKNQGIAFPLVEARTRLDAAGLMVQKPLGSWIRGCHVVPKQTWLSGWQPRPGFTQRTRPCRPTGDLAMPGNITLNGTGGGPSDEARAYFSGNDFEFYLGTNWDCRVPINKSQELTTKLKQQRRQLMKHLIIRGIGIAASVFALNVFPQQSERDDPELQYVEPFQVFDNYILAQSG